MKRIIGISVIVSVVAIAALLTLASCSSSDLFRCPVLAVAIEEIAGASCGGPTEPFKESDRERSLTDKGAFVFGEWSAEPVPRAGVLVWRRWDQAGDDGTCHMCWLDMRGSEPRLTLHVWAGMDTGTGIIAMNDSLGMASFVFTESRPILLSAVEKAADSPASDGEWIHLGTVEQGGDAFAEMTGRLAEALGISNLRTAATSVIAAEPCLEEMMATVDDGKLEAGQKVTCVRITPWTCVTEPTVFSGITPTVSGWYCNYSQTTTCTASELCGWTIICDVALWTWTRTITWRWTGTMTTGPTDAPCPPLPPAGGVPPPPPPPM